MDAVVSTNPRGIGSIGAQVGAYRLEAKISEGRMGLIYRAVTVSTGEPVALKILTHLSGDSVTLRNFVQAVSGWRRLNHPNVLAVLGMGDAAGVPYLAVPYVEGGSLRGRMREGMPADEAVRILRGAAAALDHAHLAGLVHGYLNPGNILIGTDGIAKVTDFGVADLATSEDSQPRDPAYEAPEQAGSGRSTGASDLYALAVIAYELFTARRPFEGMTPLELRYAQVLRPPPAPRTIRPELPAGVDPVLLRGLAKEAPKRFRTATEMIDALEVALVKPMLPPEVRQPGLTTQTNMKIADAMMPSARNAAGIASTRPEEPVEEAAPPRKSLFSRALGAVGLGSKER